EGVEGDAEGYDQGGEIKPHADKIANIFEEEISVFKIPQEDEIEDHRKRQQGAVRGDLDAVSGGIIEADLDQEKPEERHAPVGIEHHGQAEERPCRRGAARICTPQIKKQQARREESGEKYRIAENHGQLHKTTDKRNVWTKNHQSPRLCSSPSACAARGPQLSAISRTRGVTLWSVRFIVNRHNIAAG